MKYRRIESDMICNALENQGGDARIGLVPTEWGIQMDPREKIQNTQQMIVEAKDLAIERIRELETKLTAMHTWQEDLLRTMEEERPTNRPAENWMGWRLFCESARKKYWDMARLVATAIGDRKSEEEYQRS